MSQLFFLSLLSAFLSLFSLEGALFVGRGQAELTPPVGTPSAGYAFRFGKGMKGVLDPLFATALLIENDEKLIVFVAVDHLGFDSGMVEEVKRALSKNKELEKCALFISSSHTHSGGGAFMEMPFVGPLLAGTFDPAIRQFYIDQTVLAINRASEERVPAKIGLTQGVLEGLSFYRASYPEEVKPGERLQIIKVTTVDDQPLAVLFNYALHPTTLGSGNDLFSADFVADARVALNNHFGEDFLPLFINGAQAELVPVKDPKRNERENKRAIGKALAGAVCSLWEKTETVDHIEFAVYTHPYTLQVEENPSGLKLPLESYNSEINLIVFDKRHAILTVPGELSCVYDHRLYHDARMLGYESVAFFGLTNDAHGYIITPYAWEKKSKESELSFGGIFYGERVTKIMMELLKRG